MDFNKKTFGSISCNKHCEIPSAQVYSNKNEQTGRTKSVIGNWFAGDLCTYFLSQWKMETWMLFRKALSLWTGLEGNWGDVSRSQEVWWSFSTTEMGFSYLVSGKKAIRDILGSHRDWLLVVALIGGYWEKIPSKLLSVGYRSFNIYKHLHKTG